MVYHRYKCRNSKVTYYGKTFRHFCTRASEQMGTSNITGRRIKNDKESEISDQMLQCDQPITFDDFDILASDSNKFKLLIKESLLIIRDKPVLNRTTKSFRLPFFDQILLFTFNKKYGQFSIFNRKRKKIMNCK